MQNVIVAEKITERQAQHSKAHNTNINSVYWHSYLYLRTR